MANREIRVWIEQIDRSLKRIDQELRLNREESERARDSEGSLREFVRQQTLRMERSANQLAQQSARAMQSLDLVEKRLEDQGDQIRANTAAVLLALDRIDGGGEPAV